jgi:hypothetical protein
MSGFVPKRVSNARMRTKTNQTGLKMQGSATMLGRRGYIKRYVNRRVQTGFGVDGYPTGYRCINGIDPQGKSLKVLECNCYYARDPTINQVVLAPQPKNQSLAGGVGRIYTPRFSCGDSCVALNIPGDPNHHPHFHPPVPPPHPPVPPPQPAGPIPEFTVTMQHYGLQNGGSAPAVPTGVHDPNESIFKAYCTKYINFIEKLSKSVAVDRVQFCIDGNPGPGIPGAYQRKNYSCLVNSNGTPKDGGANGYPWVYEYFIKPFIKKSFTRGFEKTGDGINGKIRIGLTFDTSESWNCFKKAAPGGKLPLNTATTNNYETNTSVGSTTASFGNLRPIDFYPPPCGYSTWPNCGGSNPPSQPPPSTVCAAAGTSFKDDPDVNGSINQTFAYVAHINNLIINDTDPELQNIIATAGPGDFLFYLVTSASYDNEGNSGKYPGNFSCKGNNKASSSANIATTMWNQQMVGLPIAGLPGFSATGGMYDDGVTNLPSVSSGPDRIYNEIYDFGPGDFNKIPVGCPYIYGFGTNQIGWDVKAPEKEGCTPVSPPVPDYKGTTNVLTTNSKYYTLANYSGGPNPSLDPARYIFPGDSSDPLAFKTRIGETNWEKDRGDKTNKETEYNGQVLMFSIESITKGAITKSGKVNGCTEDAFGSWKYEDFIKMLQNAAKFLGPNGTATNKYSNPMFAIYEFDWLPDAWK